MFIGEKRVTFIFVNNKKSRNFKRFINKISKKNSQVRFT